MEGYEKGDIIKFKRCFGLYYHYTIYIGDNEVLHLDKQWRSASIKISKIEEVPGKLMKTSKSQNILSEETIKEAKNKIGPCKYNIFTNNCEHFVNEVSKKRRISKQIDRLKKITIAITFGVIVKNNLKENKNIDKSRNGV